MLSKSLTQLSIDGQSCVPSLLFGLRPKYGRRNEGNGNLHQKDLCLHCCVHTVNSFVHTLQQVTGHPRLGWRLLNTHRQAWLSLLWGHCFFLRAPGTHKVLFVPSKSLFPQSCGSSVIKSHWPSKLNSLGVLSPFARTPRLGNLLWVLEFMGPTARIYWYNCFIVYALSVSWFYGGADGNLLQEGLCHLCHTA